MIDGFRLLIFFLANLTAQERQRLGLSLAYSSTGDKTTTTDYSPNYTNKDSKCLTALLTHVGQSAAGLPIQLAAGQAAIRVAGSDVSFPPFDEIHGDGTAADRLETFHHLQDRVAATQTQIVGQPGTFHSFPC